MILADSEVGSLKAALYCWEWFGYISTAIVFIGCVGEFVAEFTSLPRTKETANKLARLSLIVLIFGIAGELLSTVRTSQLSGQLIANIEERASKAELEQKKIEQENIKLRIALAKLQRSSGPRYLSPQEKNELIKILSKYPTKNAWVGSIQGDSEAARFGGDLLDVFERLNWNPGRGWFMATATSMTEDSNGKRIEIVPPGITIQVPTPSNPPPAARLLKDFFDNLDFACKIARQPQLTSAQNERDTRSQYLRIVIGNK